MRNAGSRINTCRWSIANESPRRRRPIGSSPPGQRPMNGKVKEAAELDAARNRLQELQEQFNHFERVLAQRNATQETVDGIQVALGSNDPAALRKEESSLKAEDNAPRFVEPRASFRKRNERLNSSIVN